MYGVRIAKTKSKRKKNHIHTENGMEIMEIMETNNKSECIQLNNSVHVHLKLRKSQSLRQEK